MAVKFVGTSDFEAVLVDYEKLQRENAKLAEEAQKVGDKSEQGSNRASKGMSSWQTQVAGMVTGYIGLQAVIANANEALKEQTRLANEANKVQTTAAEAQADVIRNLGNVETAQASKFLADVKAISTAGGAASVAPVFEASSSTLSATGGDQDLTKLILAETVPLLRDKLGDLSSFSGAVADLATIAGATTQDQVKQAIGVVLSTQQQARITGLQGFKNAAPALAAVATLDRSDNRVNALVEGGAAFAAISSGLKDPEGAQTKTAVSALSSKLTELFDAEGTDTFTLGGRIKLAQERAAGDDAFRGKIEKLSFGEGAANQVVRSLLLDPTSETARRFQTATQVIKPDAAIAAQVIKNLETSTGEGARTTIAKRAAGNVEAFQVESQLARVANARNIAGGALEQTRVGPHLFGLDRAGLAGLDAASGVVGPENAAISLLRQRQQHLRQVGSIGGGAVEAFLGGGVGTSLTQIERPDFLLGAQRQEQIALLQKQIDLLEQTKEVQQSIDQKTKSGGASAVAAAAVGQQREGR